MRCAGPALCRLIILLLHAVRIRCHLLSRSFRVAASLLRCSVCEVRVLRRSRRLGVGAPAPAAANAHVLKGSAAAAVALLDMRCHGGRRLVACRQLLKVIAAGSDGGGKRRGVDRRHEVAAALHLLQHIVHVRWRVALQ